MKAILFLSILCFISFANAEVEKSPSIQRARKHRLELVQKQDEMLELLLQVPFEQRQYIFPLLSSKQSVPKKIKMHPEVLVWKGKKPTRIADRFKDDEELIEYLPEQFYYFLAPEMWAPGKNPNLETNPNQILKNMMNQAEQNEELSIMPDELLTIYKGLNVLQNFVKQQAKQPEFPLFFEKWVENTPKEVQQEIKEKTGLSPSVFSKKVDAVAKSYRLYQKQKTPPASDEQKLVQEYWSLIPFLFQKTGFTDTLNTQLYQD